MRMDEVIPVSRPFGPEVVGVTPVARPIAETPYHQIAHELAPFPAPPPLPHHLAERLTPVRTDHAAVASAICGMTAIIPIVSQIAGVALGILALGRIRKARRAGVIVGGQRYAFLGIFSSGLALAGWLAFGGMMIAVNKTLAHTLKPLTALSTLQK